MSPLSRDESPAEMRLTPVLDIKRRTAGDSRRAAQVKKPPLPNNKKSPPVGSGGLSYEDRSRGWTYGSVRFRISCARGHHDPGLMDIGSKESLRWWGMLLGSRK